MKVSKLVLPVFVTDSSSEPVVVQGMPSTYRFPVNDKLISYIDENYQLGIRYFIFFGIPSYKDEIGSSAYISDGVVQRTLRLIKSTFGDKVLLIADECMDEYTSHGHCGLVIQRSGNYCVENDESIRVHGKIAVSLAESGADVVAPSSMMDGVVGEIRRQLDEAGFKDTLVMSYSVKYASSLYGPFREAAGSTPAFGDRKGYQMDFRNSREAIKEARLDVEEGADILMVKPAHTYLDVIRLIKTSFPEYPLAAYHVSGEYSMIKAAASMGFINEKAVVNEVITSIFRAGADFVITYYAGELARWLKEGL